MITTTSNLVHDGPLVQRPIRAQFNGAAADAAQGHG